jgi:NTP pyrophosphatase (non-canonical NTP hydrolase)
MTKKAQGFGSSVSSEDENLTEEERRQKNEVDTNKYLEFVDFVTSDATKNFDTFVHRLAEIHEASEGRIGIQRLLTAAVGINSEGGEFMEIVKKIIFQGKPMNEDNRQHLIIELGDVMWYVAQACIALNISMDEVIHQNVTKLLKRYPEGVFDVFKSENRAATDR